ncbi:HAMP domain-containing histidine kinase [Erysipelothrix sp. HDW6C]|uniref:sensor histidine kinase n=1 Tax=Erysipelothrix sp. HDW6C TaxID=2714930 RepID=UPI001408DB7B|nr:HAMP domain-containing sensor histidine kinase [Erysipelothrix sp. HDW6C]QIK69357.1 HAMP domain-containing histidine kinase [Erysipelothrix sp. HDW6C]
MGNNPSIKWKIQRYLIVFIVVILAMLWVFQVVLLEPIYKSIKTNDIKKLAYDIQERMNDGGSINLANEALNRETHIRIVNSNGDIVDETVGIPNPMVRPIDSRELQRLFLELGDSGQTVRLGDQKGKGGDNITYALKTNESMMVVIQAQVVPVNATVNTIKVQLIFVSIILVLLSIILTHIIFKHITKPIIEINDNAKVLAQGIYTQPFDGAGYREIKELSNTLNTMRTELSKVESLRNELIANVSHDLRTPLTMIGGYAEMMQDIPEEINADNLQIIIDETHHLNALVSDMLDLAQLQSGMTHLNQTSFSLTQSILNIIERLQHHYPKRDIAFNVKNAMMINGDRLKLEQVFYNLINNALVHTNGSIVITQIDDETLTITDEGPGMSPSDIQNMWNRYYQSDTNHQRSSTGSGLGLSIVKNVLDLHGYAYDVQSSESTGTHVTISLRKDA